MTKHLWEVDHPYYAIRGNYFGSRAEFHTDFDSWEDFIEEYGNSDHDMNLIYRWDWKTTDPETDESTYTGDDNAPVETLEVFFIGQRKAKCWSAAVKVCRNDEQKVREFLLPRLQTLMKMWEPLV